MHKYKEDFERLKSIVDKAILEDNLDSHETKKAMLNLDAIQFHVKDSKLRNEINSYFVEKDTIFYKKGIDWLLYGIEEVYGFTIISDTIKQE